MTPPRDIEIHERGVGIRDNISIAQYDLAAVRRTEPRLDDLSKQAQLNALSYWDPIQVDSTHNVTCNHLHEYVATLLDPSDSSADPPTELHFGDNTALGFLVSDSEMNNKVGEIPLTDTGTAGDVFTATEFLDSTELNGETIAEIGIVSQSGGLWNHSAVPESFVKSRDVGVVINIDIPIGDVIEF